VKMRGRRVNVPLTQIDNCLQGFGDTVTFSGVREMMSNDVYLRAFTIAGDADTVIDLGSNRGLFLGIALRVLGAKSVIGVEASPKYDSVWKIIDSANRRRGQKVHRLTKLVSAEPGDRNLTLNELFFAKRIVAVDFLKCDIEGAEYELFRANTQWLSAVQNIAIEIHGSEEKAWLKRRLEQNGFSVRAMNQEGLQCVAEKWEYLYGSRTHFKVGSIAALAS
jgi:predicted RNA methylase